MALKPAEDGDGIILRVQEVCGRKTRPSLAWLGEELLLDDVGNCKIATWHLAERSQGWQAETTNILEERDESK